MTVIYQGSKWPSFCRSPFDVASNLFTIPGALLWPSSAPTNLPRAVRSPAPHAGLLQHTTPSWHLASSSMVWPEDVTLRRSYIQNLRSANRHGWFHALLFIVCVLPRTYPRQSMLIDVAPCSLASKNFPRFLLNVTSSQVLTVDTQTQPIWHLSVKSNLP